MTEEDNKTILSNYRQLIKEMNEVAALLDPEMILKQIPVAAARLTDAKIACIFEPVHSQKNFKLTEYYPHDETGISDLLIPIDGSLEGWVFANQRELIINDLEAYDHNAGEISKISKSKIESLVLLPVTIKNKRIAILEAANKITGDFTSGDLEILGSFCQFSAICYEKSQRFIQTELIPELVHELRTPLAALNTALHLLQRRDLSDAKRDHVAKLIQAEFNRLSDMTTSFLDYARLESGKDKFIFSKFDFSHLIRECLDIIQIQLDGKDLSISTNFMDESIIYSGDRDKLKQVVLNLLTNAIKYNRAGGMIHVEAYTSPTHVVLSVQDNGPGISPEYLPHLFERFYRLPNTERQIKGTGLGLTISKHIVDAHGGEIEVTSQLEEGSIFTVRLPLNAGDV